ncbi:bifunctional protein-serine/threonine kinase/phosphatase [Novosphingobium sp. PY1]|uniref:bifunctional protein-serine/threonine kinase/phosphatase n=1 Tax=Novosphingobium sp. PY1 TaxID=1882221 RepID=UPI001A8EC33D|nr:bifunctional protein-serine/threonine kinase/phosphatase [Novosphingobium sp. PY1]GFM27416.1 serine/threonine protein kinase [Novosphingobium sp. PY1]
MRNQLAVTIGQYSTAGTKEANQDFHGALVPDGEELWTKGVALALADGISTSALGAAAAETAVKSFLTDYFATSEAWSVQTSAARVISATNSWMHAQNLKGRGTNLSDEERERGMVCTLSALVLKSRSAYVFHVGDARVARVSGSVFEPLTEPHRVYLGGGESYLARALGIDRRVEIDRRKVPVARGDIFILTSDGVHDVLPDTAFLEAARGEDLDAAARFLADAALAAGSEDNLTVQILRVEDLPQSDLDDLAGEEAALPPAPHLIAGQDFEGFTVLRELHAGHRSHVYLARDDETGQRVAIKVPSTENGADPAELRRLMLEEWIARRVRNTHVLGAPAARASRRHAYAVTEFLEGATLEDWVGFQSGPTDLVAIRSIVKQVASGLQALHRLEILHRDLRPANVIVDSEGTARIIDFGSALVAGLDELAPRAEDAMFAGTMQFTAPEIWLGAGASRKSDLWSLGAIAYFMLTRSLPYGVRLSAARTRSAQRKLAYIPASEINPEVPDWMDAALARALALDPADRYEELSEFTYDFAHPNTALAAPPPRPWLARRPERLWQAISAALALALALSIATRGNEREPGASHGSANRVSTPRTEEIPE